MVTIVTLMPNIQSVLRINMTTLSLERSTNPPTLLARQTERRPRMIRTDSHVAQRSLTKLPPLTKVNCPTSVPSTGKSHTVKPVIRGHPGYILVVSPIHGHLVNHGTHWCPGVCSFSGFCLQTVQQACKFYPTVRNFNIVTNVLARFE